MSVSFARQSAAVLVLAAITHAQAHSVGQVQTAKRISQVTVAALDPEGNPIPGGSGTNTRAQVGDILSFVIRFTPVPNSATRGAGGYITEYVPANTVVVGARFIDGNGASVRPHRGPQMDDGWGPRGRHNGFDALGLQQGSLSQLYADTGIFFSTDPRTARTPADAFITVLNGLAVSPVPTGAGQLDNFLGFTGPPFHGHNSWDVLQAVAFGVNGGAVVSNGQGNTPHRFGSPVAGPDTHYPFEKVATPACSDGADNDGDGQRDYPQDPQCASALDNDETAATDAPVGPWRRIRYPGSETGTGAATDCQSCTGGYVRTGVPTGGGWDLSPDNPLPAGTNAVRFAVGELVVGEEYQVEISLRVTALPLDPAMNRDVNCSEVFGGDAAMPQNGQDNAWRYFVPAPACVSLDLQFDLDVDKIVALQGDRLVYTIHGKNLSVTPVTGVQVTDTFVAADVAFNTTLLGPAPTVGAGALAWPAMNLQPGQAFTFQWDMNVTGNALSTLNKATFISDALPAPGFSVVALTNIRALAVLAQAARVSTTPASTPPAATAGQTVHYTATFTNTGSGDASLNGASYLRVILPAGFAHCPAPTCAAPTVNGVAVADPAVAGNALTFTQGLAALPAGSTLTLDLDVTVGAGVSPGQYTVALQSQFRDPALGRDVENFSAGLAPLLVDMALSLPPLIQQPLYAGTTVVRGTTAEGQGAVVTVYVNGVPVTPVVAGPGGAFTAVVPTLFGGQHVNGTARGAGKVESLPSSPDVVVVAVPPAQCNDGTDNDGDGLVDYPQDPGCTDALDDDESGGCSADLHCPLSVPFCNTTTHLCAQCLASAHCTAPRPACDPATLSCVGCLSAADCGGATPACDTTQHACVGCLSSADCGGATPACDPLSQTCVGCLSSAECALPTPVCSVSAMTCVGCLSNADCAGALPACDTVAHVCVQCLSAAECAGNTPVCSAASRTCVECVNNFQCADTPQTPACDPARNACVGCLSDFYCFAPTPVCNPVTQACVAAPGATSSSSASASSGPGASSSTASTGAPPASGASSATPPGSSVGTGASSLATRSSSAASSAVNPNSSAAPPPATSQDTSGSSEVAATSSAAGSGTSMAAASSGGAAGSGNTGGAAGTSSTAGLDGDGEVTPRGGCSCRGADGPPMLAGLLVAALTAVRGRRRATRR